MKRKLISAVALIMCAIMFLFCGCKSKKNGDDTTAPSESGASVDVAIDESTEPSSEETTEPEKKESTPDDKNYITGAKDALRIVRKQRISKCKKTFAFINR